MRDAGPRAASRVVDRSSLLRQGPSAGVIAAGALRSRFRSHGARNRTGPGAMPDPSIHEHAAIPGVSLQSFVSGRDNNEPDMHTTDATPWKQAV